jgi:hypothetical protein
VDDRDGYYGDSEIDQKGQKAGEPVQYRLTEEPQQHCAQRAEHSYDHNGERHGPQQSDILPEDVPDHIS